MTEPKPLPPTETQTETHPADRPRTDAAGGPAAPKPFALKDDAAAGVTLLEDRRFRQMQLRFRDKPSDAVRELVAGSGYRWRPADRVWSCPIDREAGWKTRLDAERLFDAVVGLVGVGPSMSTGR